jgi:ribosomal 50S subunit-associated protein YjgA (DUF615 family)
MAKKQTRRSVSLNRDVYDIAMSEAEQQGVSLSHYVENCIREKVPDLPETTHAKIEAARKATVERARRRSVTSGGSIVRRVGYMARQTG